MTRDEAIAILVNNQARCIQNTTPLPHRIDCAAADVDSLAALGLLNFDEPVSLKAIFSDVIYPIKSEDRHVEFLWDALHRAGLKIVKE